MCGCGYADDQVKHDVRRPCRRRYNRSPVRPPRVRTPPPELNKNVCKNTRTFVPRTANAMCVISDAMVCVVPTQGGHDWIVVYEPQTTQPTHRGSGLATTGVRNATFLIA